MVVKLSWNFFSPQKTLSCFESSLIKLCQGESYREVRFRLLSVELAVMDLFDIDLNKLPNIFSFASPLSTNRHEEFQENKNL